MYHLRKTNNAQEINTSYFYLKSIRIDTQKYTRIYGVAKGSPISPTQSEVCM